MKDFFIGGLVGLAVLLSYVVTNNMAYDRGHHAGWMAGYEESSENSRKFDCEIKYSNTFRSEVPAKCIKYFTETK